VWPWSKFLIFSPIIDAKGSGHHAYKSNIMRTNELARGDLIIDVI
jgi:hypothetical protein